MLTGARAREAAAFVAVGATATATHFLVVWLLVRGASLSPAWANMPAFWIAFCVSYAGHNVFTFAGRSQSLPSSVLRWMAVSVGGFLLNQSLYMLALRWIQAVHYLVLLFFVTGIVTLMTYFLGKYWAFAASPTPDLDAMSSKTPDPNADAAASH